MAAPTPPTQAQGHPLVAELQKLPATSLTSQRDFTTWAQQHYGTDTPQTFTHFIEAPHTGGGPPMPDPADAAALALHKTLVELHGLWGRFLETRQADRSTPNLFKNLEKSAR